MNTIEIISLVSKQLSLYIPLFLLTFGNFGCLFNLRVFTNKKLTTKPCSIYFLSAAVTDFFVLNFNLLTRWLQEQFNISPQSYNQIYCKFRSYLIVLLPMLSTSFVVLASFDRFAASTMSNRIRKMSNIKTVKSELLMTTLFWVIVCLHILIFYSVQYNSITSTYYCDSELGNYGLFNSIFTVLFIGLLPVILMSTFGALTIRNTRISRQRARSRQQINQQIRRKDRQLIL
ncbi:unnamed protein product, partial [Didymodactylos carnosus]